jgi:hypothetical protein
MMVERFLACEMSLDEEREFIMLAATNAELFKTLRAYRLMEQALARNRDAMPDGDAAVRTHALALVGQTPPPPVRTAAGAGSKPAVGTATMPPRWLALAAASIVFTIAGFFLHDLIVRPAPAATPAQSTATTGIADPAAKTAVAPTMPDGEAAGVAGIAREEQPAAPSSPVASSPDAETTSPRRERANAASTPQPEPAQRAERASPSTDTPTRTSPAASGADSGRANDRGDGARETVPAREGRGDSTKPDSVNFRAKIIMPDR